MVSRGNLATKPFYNERLVTLGLVLLLVIVVALTVFNATRLTTLSSRRSALRAQIAADEAQAAQIRADASALQSSVDRNALQTLGGATRLANTLIAARTFSWTAFFEHIEDTIPYDVCLTAVSPEVEKGEFVVTMLLIGRRAEDIDTFAKALEGTGAFYDVLYTVADRTEEGLRRAHTHAFLSLAGAAFVAIPLAFVQPVIGTWIVVHLIWAQRTVYGGSWFGLIARSAVMSILYMVLFGLAIAGLLFVAILMR